MVGRAGRMNSHPASTFAALALAMAVTSCAPQPSARWSLTGAMTDCHFSDTATLLPDGRVLVAGGGRNLASAELFDLASGQWTAAGNMGEGRWQHTATLLSNGKVLVITGADLNGHPLTSTELYDPATGNWTSEESLDGDRAAHTATLLPDGKVLVVGGARLEGGFLDPLASTLQYDPNTGSWTTSGSMHEGRYFHTATLLTDGRVLVAGGRRPVAGSKDPVNTAELYDSRSGTWTSTGAMGAARALHSATLLPDGKVFVVGGTTFNDETGGPLDSAELFDPSSGTWTATKSMDVFRVEHTATLLKDGKVLIVGGSRGGAEALDSAELFDPRTGEWDATATMGARRFGHTATFLTDGTVLVASGASGRDDCAGEASAELYHADGGS